MQNQDSVIVQNEELDSHGQAGRVVCAAPYDLEGVSVVDVELDTEKGEIYQFPVADLKVL